MDCLTCLCSGLYRLHPGVNLPTNSYAMEVVDLKMKLTMSKPGKYGTFVLGPIENAGAILFAAVSE